MGAEQGGRGGQQPAFAAGQCAFHRRVDGGQARQFRRARRQRVAQAGPQKPDGGVHGLLQEQVALAEEQVIGGILRAAAPGGGIEGGVFVDGTGQRGAHAGAVRFHGFGRSGFGERIGQRIGLGPAVQRGGQGDGVGPVDPVAQPVRQRLRGRGDVRGRQAGQQTDERRATNRRPLGASNIRWG